MNVIKKYFNTNRKLRSRIKDLDTYVCNLTKALSQEGEHSKSLLETRFASEDMHRRSVDKNKENRNLQIKVFELENKLARIKRKPIPPIPSLRAIRIDRIDAMLSLDMGENNIDNDYCGTPGAHAVELVMQGGHKIATIMDIKDIERYTNKIKKEVV